MPAQKLEGGNGVVGAPEVKRSIFECYGLLSGSLVEGPVTIGHKDPVPVVEGVVGWVG